MRRHVARSAAIAAICCGLVLGPLSILWWLFNVEFVHIPYIDLCTGLYSIALSFISILTIKKPHIYRAVLYICALPLACSSVTLVAAVIYVFAAFMSFRARLTPVIDESPDVTMGMNHKLLFLLYTLCNILLFALTFRKYYNATALPYAKGFGALLDLNCALLIVFVMRTTVRSIYSFASRRNCGGSVIRAITSFIPPDSYISFHKTIARLTAIFAVAHTVAHYVNYTIIKDLEIWSFVSGIILCILLTLIVITSTVSVRRKEFEVFLGFHYLFIPFYALLLFHGKGGINPNFWKYFIVPGLLYIAERLIRIHRARLPTIITSVTFMDDVYSVELARVGILEESFYEGQYIYVCCPSISQYQWHPFTISSAPQDKTVTIHIRASGNWTKKFADFTRKLGTPSMRKHYSFQVDQGFDIIQLHGPYSAPTQHMSEYSTVAVITAGIGSTPLSSTLKSMTHKWMYSVGNSYPQHTFFVWVCSHKDLYAFRWLIRIIKECVDVYYHQKTLGNLEQFTFALHIYVTSRTDTQVVDDEFWGIRKIDSGVRMFRTDWDELDLFRALNAAQDREFQGNVYVWNGRPDWEPHFIQLNELYDDRIGVLFCGNKNIGRDLQKKCNVFNRNRKNPFILHRENF